MSALVDELRSVLGSFRSEIGTWVNQGLAVSVEGHLKQLEAAAAAAEQDGQAAVHRILTDLYTAFHAPAQAVPAAPEIPAPAPGDAAPAAPAEEPLLATGGTVAGPGTAVVAESGPETVALPDGAAAAPAAPVTTDPTPAAEPAADAPAVATPAAEAAVPTGS